MKNNMNMTRINEYVKIIKKNTCQNLYNIFNTRYEKKNMNIT